MSPQEAARGLLAATEDLGRAIERGDWDGLEKALAVRQERFAVLRDVGVRGDAELRPVIERVRALDRELEAATSGALDALRIQFSEIGATRRAARGYRGPEEPPRFIARRV